MDGKSESICDFKNDRDYKYSIDFFFKAINLMTSKNSNNIILNITS